MRAVAVAAAAAALALVLGPASATGGTEVRVRVGEQPASTVVTHAVRPVGVLRAAGVSTAPNDRVLPVRHGRVVKARANKDVRSGDTVKVVRIRRQVSFRHSAVKPGTVVHKTTKLAPGKRQVVRPGHRGVRRTASCPGPATATTCAPTCPATS